jgi:hypothetical protein
MKIDQRFTPKYWVFHNKLNDDVYLQTAAKGYDQCQDKAKALYPKELNDFHENEQSNYDISSIELRLWVDE